METALDKLKKLSAWNAVPELTESELEELLTQFSLVDAAGLAPSHEEWTPTYDLNAAASNAWLVKAARAANTTETEPDSINVTSKIFENCCRMAALYRSKRNHALSFAQPAE